MNFELIYLRYMNILKKFFFKWLLEWIGLNLGGYTIIISCNQSKYPILSPDYGIASAASTR